MNRLARWIALALVVAGSAIGAGGCASTEPQVVDKEQPFYVTGSNIGRRDREIQRVQAVSGDALRSGHGLPDAVPRPEEHRGAQ